MLLCDIVAIVSQSSYSIYSVHEMSKDTTTLATIPICAYTPSHASTRMEYSCILGVTTHRVLGLAGFSGRRPRVPRGTVRRLVDRHGVAGLSLLQWRSVRSPLAGVSSDDECTVGTLALASG